MGAVVRSTLHQAVLLKGAPSAMVRVSASRGRHVYVCDECGLGYETSRLANACQAYCSENQSCSLKITRHAVYRPGLVRD